VSEGKASGFTAWLMAVQGTQVGMTRDQVPWTGHLAVRHHPVGDRWWSGRFIFGGGGAAIRGGAR